MASSNSGESSKRKGNFKKRNSEGSGSSRSDPSTSPRNTRPTENQERTFDNVLYYGTVLFVNYEKRFGMLTPSMPSTANLSLDAGTRKNDVYFRVDAPGAGDQSTSTMTGGMLLIKGDTLEYVLQKDNLRGQATRRATLCKCKDRQMDELVEYVKSLVATAQERPDIVLRNVTRCPAPLEYVLNYDNPSGELVKHTLVLCQTLQRSKLITEVYRSKLKQMYTLFCGSRFLLSEAGVKKCCRHRGGDESLRNLLKDFLVHLLESIPSQLLQILPLLMRLGACEKSGTTGSDVTIFTELEAGKQILPCEGGNFLMKILNTIAGGRTERPGSQPWAQLPLLPTMEELVKLPSRGGDSTLPVVRQKGPYSSPEDYIDTYFRLLREDCFAGLLLGIQAFREGKLDDRDMKMWFGVATVGVHFNHTSSPGLTFAVRLPQIKKGGKAPKAPDYGSLVCFSDDGGSFDTPIWCVVRQCEDVADKACICFVDIVIQIGDQVELSSANSLSMQCARLMKGEDMAMAESPTAYYAYQPVLDALHLTDPQTIPFKEELVSVTWPSKAPDYLKSASTTLDWSCIFKPPPQSCFSRCPSFVGDTVVPASGEIREGVGGVKSLMKQGYTTTFDECQLKAVELAVSNRLTIIQGPPGTGKTYIASRLLQLLLSANTFPKESPILVITFKNHALDQFLEKCLTFCKGEDSIVRVGSRCKNENLEKYNLKNRETRNDEFRFEFQENIQRTKEIQQNTESALKDFNKCLLSFDPLMVIAPELQLHYFLNRLAHPDRVQAICARMLPEGFSLAEVLILDEHPQDADPGWVTDILWLKHSLVAEIKRWIPKPEVFRTVQGCFSTKKPSRIRPPQRVVSAATNATEDKTKAAIVDGSDEEEDDKEEQERRSAYESMSQDIKLEDLDAKSAHGTSDARNKNRQWLQSEYFMAFSKERDVHQASVAYAHLDLDGSQFDWLVHADPYDLLPERRAILVYKYWQRSVDVAWQRLARIKAQYDTILQDTEEISKRRKLAILQKAKIIGITTTGAAMLQSVLKCLSPAVILVEEAAEILEPNVLAVLNPNLQHLILIGDHEQLRPTVASYPLDRWHGFSVSMFERLVKHNELPYQPLSRQCRMRDEFVPMLLPIYKFLKSHTALVSGSRNKAPTCMVKTMYFWAHTHQETSERSYVNQGEAIMVVALARWIVSELQNPQGLKILAAYGGQVTIIQKMLEQYPDLKEVEVYTIDRFQGAESEIVIVSLVRSNPIGKIGYLSDRSRLCVAASRARAGVYFVGNHDTLTEKSGDWRTLISYFERQQAISCSIPLRCPRHPRRPPYALNNSAASKFEPGYVCDHRCEEVMPCGHVCSSTCHLGTHSLLCKERVPFTFRFCGHTHTKMCHQDHEQDLSCKTTVMHKFENCKHFALVECREIKGNRKLSLVCKMVCGKTLKCGHPCRLRCSDNCEGTPCHSCAQIEREKEKLRRQLHAKAIEDKQKELEVEIQKLQEKANEGILVYRMHPDGDTAEAYSLAKDRVEMLSIQPDSKTSLKVTKVEKIENLQLQRKFLEAQRELISPLEIPKWLFYGGPDDLLDQVVNKRFKTKLKQDGYYFDVYSSTTAQERHGKLLLCEVHLGKTWRYPRDKDSVNLSKLRDRGYDSLTLAADDQDLEWELKQAHKHVIVNPEQAIPRFIVSYRVVDFQAEATAEGYVNFGEQQALKTNGVCRLPLMPSSNVEEATPQELHFRRAESQFFRKFDYSGAVRSKLKVTKVEVVINLALKEKYLQKKKEFEGNNVAVEEMWVFHGTDTGAIDKIASQGFKIGGTEGVAIKVGALYGPGVYIAMNPDISVPYSGGSKMLLMATAVPGVRNTHHNIGQNENVLVIKDVSQLLPKYVIHYT